MSPPILVNPYTNSIGVIIKDASVYKLACSYYFISRKVIAFAFTINMNAITINVSVFFANAEHDTSSPVQLRKLPAIDDDNLFKEIDFHQLILSVSRVRPAKHSRDCRYSIASRVACGLADSVEHPIPV